MEETQKVTAVIISCVVMGLAGFAIKGIFGAIMGFVLTFLVIWFFTIWNNYKGE